MQSEIERCKRNEQEARLQSLQLQSEVARLRSICSKKDMQSTDQKVPAVSSSCSKEFSEKYSLELIHQLDSAKTVLALFRRQAAESDDERRLQADTLKRQAVELAELRARLEKAHERIAVLEDREAAAADAVQQMRRELAMVASDRTYLAAAGVRPGLPQPAGDTWDFRRIADGTVSVAAADWDRREKLLQARTQSLDEAVTSVAELHSSLRAAQVSLVVPFLAMQ